LSLLAMVESYALIDKVKSSKIVSSQQTKVIEQTIQNPVPIKSTSVQGKSQTRGAEKLT
jgi:hypothetical protein